jgi:UDP-glucose:glycoprotein glucosyltransferase
MVIITDLDSVEGEALLQEAVTFVSVSKLCNVCFWAKHTQREDSQSRITFLHNPDAGSAGGQVSSLIARIRSTNDTATLSPDVFRRALDGVKMQDAAQVIISEGTRLRPDPQAYTAFLTTSRLLAREVGLQPGEQAVLVNGRVRCLFVSHGALYNKPSCVARRSHSSYFGICFRRLCDVGNLRNEKASWTCRASP